MTEHTTPRLIAGDDDLVQAQIYGDMPWQPKIAVRVTRNAGSDEPQEFHFGLHPEDAEEFAHRLLELASGTQK